MRSRPSGTSAIQSPGIVADEVRALGPPDLFELGAPPARIRRQRTPRPGTAGPGSAPRRPRGDATRVEASPANSRWRMRSRSRSRWREQALAGLEIGAADRRADLVEVLEHRARHADDRARRDVVEEWPVARSPRPRARAPRGGRRRTPARAGPRAPPAGRPSTPAVRGRPGAEAAAIAKQAHESPESVAAGCGHGAEVPKRAEPAVRQRDPGHDVPGHSARDHIDLGKQANGHLRRQSGRYGQPEVGVLVNWAILSPVHKSWRVRCMTLPMLCA